MRRGHGTSVIFITHDLGVVAQLCDTVAVMYAGQGVRNAPAARRVVRRRCPSTAALMAAMSAAKGCIGWRDPDQEPIGTGPFMPGAAISKDAVIRYKAFPQFWGGKAKIDDLVFSITPDASVRWAKLQKGECHVMPYPNPADLDAIRKDPNDPGARAARAERRLPRLQHAEEAVRRRARVRKAVNMAINKKAIIDACVPVDRRWPRRTRSRRPMWSYNDADQGRPVRS